MNFYILRRGQKLGPFSEDSAEQMSAQGELRAGDLVSREGAQDWLPLGRFLELLRHPELAADAPSAADGESSSTASEHAPAYAPVPSRTSFLRRTDGDADDATLTEAEREVIAGGRFIAFEYCFSLVVSFKHTSAPVLVRAGDDGFGPALRYSLISMLLGWWGIPGFVWVLTTVRHNAKGGRDVTLEALTTLVGHARAASACARHRPSAQSSQLLGALGGMMTALGLALWLGVGWAAWGFTHRGTEEQAVGPGAKEFETANKYLVQAKRSSIFGNVPKALELADAFNTGARESYLALAKENPTLSGLVTNNPPIVTFCEVHEDRVIFLVQAPGLQKFPPSLLDRFGDAAWRRASLAITDCKVGFVGLRVAVGIRSPAKYEQVLLGRYVRDFESNNTGLRSRSEGHRSKSKLFPLFIPLEQLESWKDE